MREMDVKRKFKEYMVPISDGPIIVSANGYVVQDIDGKEYIDFISGPGVVNFGHCRSSISEAIIKQAVKLTQCPGRGLNNISAANLAEKVALISPGALKKCYFCNTGTEAVENAMRLALKYACYKNQGRTGIISLYHSFHGRTALPASIGGLASYKTGYAQYGLFPGVEHIPAPYCYRCPLSYPACDLYCAGRLEEAIKCGNGGIFIAEPIMSNGGIIVPPENYWQTIREICNKYEITLVFDEIFVGFGRTGKLFASEHWECIPDIMTIGKALGGGLPLSGFVTSSEVSDILKAGDFYSTFGYNNVVALEAGLAGIELLLEEKLHENAEIVGNYLMSKLNEIKDRFEEIGDIRGKGLLIGLEIVTDRKSKCPATDLTSRIVSTMMEKGILVTQGGSFRNIIRLIPPLIITKDIVDNLSQVLIESIEHSLKQ